MEFPILKETHNDLSTMMTENMYVGNGWYPGGMSIKDTFWMPLPNPPKDK